MNHPLLDLPPVNATRFAAIEDHLATLLGTTSSLVLLQAEASAGLEAAALGVGRPGVTVLNVVSGPYGGVFGQWLRTTGATVVELPVAFDGAVSAQEVGRILDARPEIAVVSLVHAEAATGNKNPLAAVAETARVHGALLVVDAVASVGAEPLFIDQWGIDLCIVGPQKALAGPAGVSAVSVSARAWRWMEENDRAPRQSALSLLDWKHRWIDTGRTSLPVIPSTLDLLSLEAALFRLETEGMAGTIARHRAAATAARAGLRALGLEPWVARDDEAAHVATTLHFPPNRSAAEVARVIAAQRSTPLSVGIGSLSEQLIRINHTGRGANPKTVTNGLTDLFTVALGQRPHGSADAGRLAAAQSLVLDVWERAVRGEAVPATVV